jgi:uncharacterized membrane protein YkoI
LRNAQLSKEDVETFRLETHGTIPHEPKRYGLLMTPRPLVGWLLAGTVLFALAMAAELAMGGARLESQAKVSLKEAQAIAQKTYPGHIESEELEKEVGGSGLRYSFVIRNKSTRHEVGIDAQTGRVLENSVEGRQAD